TRKPRQCFDPPQLPLGLLPEREPCATQLFQSETLWPSRNSKATAFISLKLLITKVLKRLLPALPPIKPGAYNSVFLLIQASLKLKRKGKNDRCLLALWLKG